MLGCRCNGLQSPRLHPHPPLSGAGLCDDVGLFRRHVPRWLDLGRSLETIVTVASCSFVSDSFRTGLRLKSVTMRTFGHGLLLLGAALSQVAGVTALSGAEWRKQSVYQVVTDRFARTDGSTTAKCDPKEQVYCGGTYKGLIDKLDYIQGMGFTAVWISPVVKNIDGLAADG